MKVKILVASIAIIGLNLPVAQATNGYFSHGYGMKAKGMAGAATATAQDAMGGANNPASMVWVGDRLDLGIDWFRPIRSASRTGSSAVGLVPPAFAPFFAASSLNFNESSSSNNFLIPEFGYNKMWNPNLSLGVTVYGNGGMNTAYRSGSAIPAGNCPTPTGPSPVANNPLCGQGELGVNLEQLIIAPTVAYKINANHSIGVSPLIAFQHFRANGLQAFSQISSSPGNLTDRGHDSSNGWGLRLGWMGKINNNLTLGATYSSKIRMSKFDNYRGLFAEDGDFDIPSTFTLGAAFKPLPQWTIALDYQRINYSDAQSVSNPSTSPALLGQAGGIGFGWSDIDVWKLGVSYDVNSSLTLRAGWNHGDNPIQSRDVTFNILAPGIVQDHFTLGATYKINPSNEITVAYMHAKKETVSGAPNTVYFPAGGTESIQMYQDSLGVSWGMKF